MTWRCHRKCQRGRCTWGDHLRCMNLSMDCQLSYFSKFVPMEPPSLDEYECHVVGGHMMWSTITFRDVHIIGVSDIGLIHKGGSQWTLWVIISWLDQKKSDLYTSFILLFNRLHPLGLRVILEIWIILSYAKVWVVSNWSLEPCLKL